MSKKKNQNIKGAIHGCCIGLILIGFLFIVSIFAFYFIVWKVPSKEQKAQEILADVENSINQKALIPKDKNSWTYYKKAIDKLDLSKLLFNVTPKGGGRKLTVSTNMPATSHYVDILRNMRNISFEPCNPDLKKNVKLFKELSIKNKDVVKNVDKAFKIKTFNMGKPQDVFNFQNFSYKNLVDYNKTKMLMAYLVLLGDYEKYQGHLLVAAKRYMEALYLQEYIYCNSINFITIQYLRIEPISRIKELILKHKNNKNLLIYLDKYLNETPQMTFLEYMKIRFYILNDSMDHFGKSPSSQGRGSNNQGLPKFLLERERKVMYIVALGYMESYKKDPFNFMKNIRNLPGGIKSIFSLSGNSIRIFLEMEYPRFLFRKVRIDGLKILTALEIYKIDKGKYPDKLDRLIPKYIKQIPKDPYNKDGKYVYILKNNKIILYSYGPNQIDDKGANAISSPYGDGDIIFTVIKTSITSKPIDKIEDKETKEFGRLLNRGGIIEYL